MSEREFLVARALRRRSRAEEGWACDRPADLDEEEEAEYWAGRRGKS